MELTTANITEYLKQVSTLESSVYEQQKCYENARSNVNGPIRQEVSMPVKRIVTVPEEPTKSNYSKIVKSPLFWFGFAGFLFSIVFIACGAAIDLTVMIVLGAILTVCGIGLMIAGALLSNSFRRDYSEAKEKYEIALKEYESEVKKADFDYQQACANYEKKIELENIRYESALKSYRFAENSLQALRETQHKTEQALEEAYGYDIIYPKYRSLVAVFTILEYFETGRCSELSGPNGAYNLYESELRQNLILSKLDTIISQLDQIKDNQFLLYSKLTEINNNVRSVSSIARGLLDTSRQIEANTRITAYCSEITAQNTAALAAIAVLK